MTNDAMTIVEGIEGLGQLPAGAVVSIGNFDGVHRGHQRLLARARKLKQAAAAPAVGVITFEPHPLTVLRPGHAPPRLTSPGRKRELLAAAGVDAMVVLAPSKELLNLTAEEFWELLRDVVRPAHLVEGNSFTFGKGRGGTIERLRQWSAGAGIELHIVDPVTVPLLNMLEAPASSSTIRWLLERGRVRDAAICLGRPHELEGLVVAGARRGREIGTPTANLKCDGQLVPADGVYAGRCSVEGQAWPAAVSIGTNPTFGDNPRTVEAHLIGFSGDLYGRLLRLELLDWQREQRTFAGIEPLKAWIAQDIRETLLRQARDPAQPLGKVRTIEN
jgi:riboflavin kinase/FMN adenylyltransferase